MRAPRPVLTIYLGTDLHKTVQEEAKRTDRAASWVIRKLCKYGLAEFRKRVPSSGDTTGPT